MKQLLLEPATKKIVGAYTKAPAHALLLTGPKGVGLGTLATQLADSITQHATDIVTIAPEQTTIPIERVRMLYEQTRSIHSRPQAIVIDDAETMSHDAQNALLKLLEEPVKNVYFILTSHYTEGLLPTIRSRVQAVGVKQLTHAQSEKLLDELNLIDGRKRSQALFLASGMPAELTRLASDETYFTEQVTYVEDARAIIQGNLYERLRTITSYTDRVKALKLISVIGRLMTFSLLKQKQMSVLPAVDALDLASERIHANGHVRTQLMYLMTKLP